MVSVAQSRKTKPICRRGPFCAREASRETPYGVTTSVPDCTNKANSAAGTCTAIRGELGRSPYPAKQSRSSWQADGGQGPSCEGTGGRGVRNEANRETAESTLTAAKRKGYRRNVGYTSVKNKANLRNKTWAGRPRHETPYGVSTSTPGCANKADSAARTCAAIWGERGRSPYRAKQSQSARRTGRGFCRSCMRAGSRVRKTKPIGPLRRFACSHGHYGKRLTASLQTGAGGLTGGVGERRLLAVAAGCMWLRRAGVTDAGMGVIGPMKEWSRHWKGEQFDETTDISTGHELRSGFNPDGSSWVRRGQRGQERLRNGRRTSRWKGVRGPVQRQGPDRLEGPAQGTL